MQPYLFPYIGYFQLLSTVDCFVIYDDVQWIKGGWINRNRILVEGRAHYLTLPILDAPLTYNINQRHFVTNISYHKKKILKQIEQNYKKAPHFDSTFELIARVFNCRTENASEFITNALRETCSHLKIDTPFVISSHLQRESESNAMQRVIETNQLLNADHYINAIGGKTLYDKANFSNAGLQLSFLKTRKVEYVQFQNEFIPMLSIIDVMMFNSVEIIADFLDEFDLE